MSTKRAGGSSVVSQRPRKSRKKQCEEGSACPYQHEYQHQLEFAHDGTSSTTTTTSRTPNSSAGRRGQTLGGGGGGTSGRGTAGRAVSSLNGTGARGRKVAVAADRRRAERTLRQGTDQNLLEAHGGDAREAQRTRWVMRMQQDIEQAPPPVRRQQHQDAATGGGGGAQTHGGGSQSRARGHGPCLTTPLEVAQPLPPPPRATRASSPSSISMPLRDLVAVGGGTNQRERAPAGTGRVTGTHGRREQQQNNHREVICLDCDSD
ncbi:unnamed protein product [Ectocarpus sp. 6 AP-2014]